MGSSGTVRGTRAPRNRAFLALPAARACTRAILMAAITFLAATSCSHHSGASMTPDAAPTTTRTAPTAPSTAVAPGIPITPRTAITASGTTAESTAKAAGGPTATVPTTAPSAEFRTTSDSATTTGNSKSTGASPPSFFPVPSPTSDRTHMSPSTDAPAARGALTSAPPKGHSLSGSSRPVFINAADAVCETARVQLDALPQPIGPSELIATLNDQLRVQQDALNSLQSLPQPEGDRAEITARLLVPFRNAIAREKVLLPAIGGSIASTDAVKLATLHTEYDVAGHPRAAAAFVREYGMNSCEKFEYFRPQ